MSPLSDQAHVFAITWAVLSPVWLLTLAAQVWGRTVLTRDDVRKGLLWTLGASAAAFPAVWGTLSYLAGFNPQPRSSQIEVGGRLAGLLLPVYSALLACIAFEFRIQAARERGAPPRALAVRVLAGLVVALTVMLNLLGLLLGMFAATGPKAFG